jgi:TetR/AcrR family transcriptional repressor of mexJK operon
MVNYSNCDKPDKTGIILMAAQKRFAHYGLIKTSMNDIALDIGMSKASLYYYFADKEAIFQEVIKKEQKEFINHVKKIMSEEVNASALLISYVKKRLAYFQVFINISKLNSDTLKSVKPIFAQLSQKFNEEEISLVKNILKRGIKSGEFEKINEREYAKLFVSLIQSLRSNLILKKDMDNLDKKDFQILEKQFINVAKIFSKGIKK